MDPSHVDALWREAQRHEGSGHLAEARDRYEEVVRLELEQRGEVRPYILERLTRVLLPLRQFEAATFFLRAAQSTLARDGDAYGVFRMTVGLAEVNVHAGNLDEAERHLSLLEDDAGPWGPPHPDDHEHLGRRAETAAFPRCGPRDLALARAEACCVLARLWAAGGRFSPAASIAAQALSIATPDTPWISRSDVALLLAETRLDSGDLKSPLELERDFAKESDKPAALRWRLLRGRIETMTGRLGAAQQFLRGVLAEARDANLIDIEVRAAWSLAQLLATINRLQDAEELLSETIERPRSAEASEAWNASFERLRGLMSKRGGAVLPPLPEQVLDIEKALEERAKEEVAGRAPSPARPALDDTTTPADDPAPQDNQGFLDEIASRINEILLHVHGGQFEDATARLGSLVTWTSYGDSPYVALRVGYCRGLLSYARGDYHGARSDLERAASIALERALSLEEWQIRRVLSWACARLEDDAAYVEHASRAKDLLDRLASSLNPEDRVFFLLNKGSAQDDFLVVRERWIDKAPAPRIPIAALRAWVRRRRVEGRRLQVYQEVSCLTGWDIDRRLSPAPPAERAGEQASPDVAVTGEDVGAWTKTHLELLRAASGSTGEFSLSQYMLWRIPSKVVIVHFYAVAEKLFVFVLRRRRLSHHVVPTTKIMLERAARGVLEKMDNPSDSSPDWLSLMTMLIGLDAIIEELPGSIERLIVIPHDVLTNLPFCALRLCDGRFLCERFTLSYLPNLRAFDPARRAPADRERAPFLGVGITEFAGLEPLPHAFEEIEAVAALLPIDPERKQLLRDSEATLPRVAQALGGAAWAHFASHGEFDARAPHRSHLCLSRGGSLTLLDVMALDLRLLNLAIVACCWLSSAAVLPGNEAVCMPAAFLHAGARAVIAPLWQVDDAVNIELMKELYPAIVKWGPARGLAEVQRAWLRATDGERSLPFHWASYALYGNG